MTTLADRVEQEDAQRFVGRATELGVFDQILTGDGSVRVVLVHGAGGMGKSTLLREVDRRARRDGWETRAIDGRSRVPGSRELERQLTRPTEKEGLLVLLDTFDRLGHLGALLRTRILPALPDRSLIVVAQRAAPDPDWLQGGWERVTRALELAPVSREEGRELLRREGIVDPVPARALLDWAAGSPLALSVGADSLRDGGDWSARLLDDRPQLAELLVRRLTEDELDSSYLDVVAVASIARRTDAAMLADVLPGVDGPAAEEWLRSLTFTEAMDGAVTLHDLVRSALRARVRRQHPERERELRRRIVEHLYARAAGGEAGLMPDLADLVDNEAIRWGLGGEGLSGLRTDDARIEDFEQAGPLAESRGLPQWLEATVALIADAPQCALVARDDDDEICGLCISVTPRNATPAAERDPVLSLWLAHARKHFPDGNVMLWRDSLDVTEGHGHQSSRVLAIMNTAAVLRSGLANPRWSYLPIDPTNAAAVQFARSVGAERIPGLDVHLDDRVHECHLLDHGPGGMLAAHRATVYAELGLRAPPPGSEPALGASSAISIDTVKEALRSLDRPLELARSPLAQGATPRERAASVRALVADATQGAFGEDPTERLLRELVQRRYLGEPTTHELVADQLHISRSTYFRHLRVALDRLAEYAVQTHQAA